MSVLCEVVSGKMYHSLYSLGNTAAVDIFVDVSEDLLLILEGHCFVYLQSPVTSCRVPYVIHQAFTPAFSHAGCLERLKACLNHQQ
jgi:hypothetical protein